MWSEKNVLSNMKNWIEFEENKKKGCRDIGSGIW